MEARKITVVSTRNQKKSVIMSAATTLAELKADLRQNGIDYDNMTFYEGTSKVELKDDASVLPHDVLYKGQTTNELVFMLTNTNKKIKSGLSSEREQAYNGIALYNLQGECVRRFGKNFTLCKTADLIALVNEKAGINKDSAKEEVVKTKKTVTVPTEYVDIKARAAISKLLTILKVCDIIEDYKVREVEDIFGNTTDVSSYSDDEIKDMFGFME